MDLPAEDVVVDDEAEAEEALRAREETAARATIMIKKKVIGGVGYI